MFFLVFLSNIFMNSSFKLGGFLGLTWLLSMVQNFPMGIIARPFQTMSVSLLCHQF